MCSHAPLCASACRTQVRQLFQHAVKCTQKVTGGCSLCKKMWCLLNLHAKSCTTSDCPVPRCRWVQDTGVRPVGLSVWLIVTW
jgi:E1A/CREB-binding protein